MLTLIIVSYLRGELLEVAVQTLIRNRKHTNTKVLIVRNGQDASVVSACERLKTLFPDAVSVLELEENIGYGQGLNAGLAQVTTPYVAFLNDDIRAMRGYDDVILDHLGLPGVGAVGIDACQIQIKEDLPLGPRFEFAGKDPFKPVDYLEGWFLAGLTGVFRSVGGMSPEYGLAFSEDVDFCWKLVEAGYSLLQIPRVIDHLYHQTVRTQKAFDLMEQINKNNKILYEKWNTRRVVSLA